MVLSTDHIKKEAEAESDVGFSLQLSGAHRQEEEDEESVNAGMGTSKAEHAHPENSQALDYTVDSEYSAEIPPETSSRGEPQEDGEGPRSPHRESGGGRCTGSRRRDADVPGCRKLTNFSIDHILGGGFGPKKRCLHHDNGVRQYPAANLSPSLFPMSSLFSSVVVPSPLHLSSVLSAFSPPASSAFSSQLLPNRHLSDKVCVSFNALTSPSSSPESSPSSLASPPSTSSSRHRVPSSSSSSSSCSSSSSPKTDASSLSRASSVTSTVTTEKPTGGDSNSSPSDKQLPWPAWVYCTRYSDRPSSGPRYRKPRQKRAVDKRPRTAFSTEQLHRLRSEFQDCPYLSEARRVTLATELGLSESQVKIWFQNKRAKLKKGCGVRNPLAKLLMEEGLYNHSTIVVKDAINAGNDTANSHGQQ